MSKKKKNKDKDTVFVDTIKDVKYVLSLLEDINQPINTQLSSLLQICCMLSADVTVIEYLLQKGANPNYLDYRGLSSKDYTFFNKNPIARLLIYGLLERYEDKFPKEDAYERRKEILEWALSKDKKPSN